MLASQRVGASHIATSLYETSSVISTCPTLSRLGETICHKKEAGITYRSISHGRAMWRMIRIMVIGRMILESDTNSNATFRFN